MRKFLLPMTAALLLSTTALHAQDGKTVKSVDVETELTAIANPAAATYWANISQDLQAAILSRLSDQISDEGVDVNIDISEVELSNGFQELIGAADTKLSGRVKMTHASDNTRFETYDLTVDVNQVIPFLPEGFDVTVSTTDTPEFYKAMIDTFADAVVARLS